MTLPVIGGAFVAMALGVGVAAAVTGRRGTLRLMAATLLASSCVLAWLLLTSDFSVDYVVRTTSLATPWPYRLAGLWGGMEGSLLFYVTLAVGVGSWPALGKVGVRSVALPGVGLLAIVLVLADPFQVLDIPAVDGQGLLAILQHPAMIYHPPILYLGLTSLVVPFALTMEHTFGSLDRAQWRVQTRRWMYVSWTLLTLGMVAGANWAYAELGWGGFWAWDPVENTSLMPWLAATAFVHSSRIEEANGGLTRWNTFMGGLPFVLTVVGVYLTRSGATGSIHSFAEDPAVGVVLIVASALTLGLMIWSSSRVHPGSKWVEGRLNRQGWLGINTVLISLSVVVVAAGSIYPAVRSVFFDETAIVDSTFFVVTMLPIAIGVGVGLGLPTGRTWRPFVVGTLGGAVLGLTAYGPGVGLLLFAPAFGAVVSSAMTFVTGPVRPKQLVHKTAHLGMAILLVGVAGSSFGDDFEGPMRVGDSVEVGGHTVTLVDLSLGESDRYQFVSANFEVGDEMLSPQIRAYESQPLPIAEPVVSSDPVDDVVIAISLLFPDGETVDVSVFVRPLVWWVWFGALVVFGSGLIFLFSKAGAGAEQRRLARAEPQREETTSDTDVL